MLGVDHPSQTGSHTRTRIWDLAHDKGFQNFCKILNLSAFPQVPCSAASSPNCAPDWSLHPRFPWFRSGALVYQIDSLRRSSIVNRKSGYLNLKVGRDDTHAFAVTAFWDVLMIIYISQSQRLLPSFLQSPPLVFRVGAAPYRPAPAFRSPHTYRCCFAKRNHQKTSWWPKRSNLTLLVGILFQNFKPKKYI